MPFEFNDLRISDVKLIDVKVFGDDRGKFFESYKKSEFLKNNIPFDFLQDNISYSVKNVLRGLHFQKPPFEQGKLIHVIKGEIFDVAVDVRKSSPTFGEWVSVKLCETKKQLLFIPPGFAHGFCVLSDEVIFQYKVTSEYNPAAESGIIWNDEKLSIDWPVNEPLLSDKDKILPLFDIVNFK